MLNLAYKNTSLHICFDFVLCKIYIFFLNWTNSVSEKVQSVHLIFRLFSWAEDTAYWKKNRVRFRILKSPSAPKLRPTPPHHLTQKTSKNVTWEQWNLAGNDRGNDHGKLRTAKWTNIHIELFTKSSDLRKLSPKFPEGGHPYSADTDETLTQSWSRNLHSLARKGFWEYGISAR